MTWPQDAYVGQKVVRFRDAIDLQDDLTVHPCPPLGEPVTITWLKYNILWNVILIDLKEYPAPKIKDEWLRGWDSRIFRPVQSTGMSILKKLLVPTKEIENV